MKILIADKFAETGVATLQGAAHAVVYDPSLKADALNTALATEKPQVLVVRSTKVTAEMMDVNTHLELIVRAGAGYDTIDTDGASRRGIFVANCPGKNAIAVAELAFGLILALDRQIPDNVADLRAGQWDKARYSKADGLKGKTIGLIGLGNIGRAVARRAQAFEMNVVAWSRSLTEAQATALNITYKATPLAVATASDVVSVHVAATADTQHLVNEVFLDAMKPNAVLINTARGSVVDETALQTAMETKGIRAGLDVFSNEPQAKQGPWTHPIAQHPNVYGTHHIGASTAQATAAIGAEAVRVILQYAETGEVANCVNMATQSPATHLLTVRHLDQVGVLAGVLDEMQKAGWNVQEMENLIFAGAEAACARIRFDGTPSEAVVTRILAHDAVLAVSLIPL